MLSPQFFRRFACWLVFGASWLPAVQNASAQQQDRIDHILRPDRNMHAEGFGKAFGPATGSNEKKSFVTRLFGAHAASSRAGDGSFHTSGFLAGRDGYATADFTTRKLPEAGRTAAFSEHAFGTKSLVVREDAGANKTAATHEYVHPGRPFLGEGKRQDDIDDLRRQKNLSIDQIREILNKKG